MFSIDGFVKELSSVQMSRIPTQFIRGSFTVCIQFGGS